MAAQVLRPDMSRPASVSPASLPTSPRARPTDDDIEAVIQLATSSRPTPDGRSVPLRDTRTQLFVGNLPYRVRWQDLKDLFRKAGTVLRADVSLGPDNRSRGYGTVLLATAEDAGRAIDMFNGYNWQTRVLEVRPDRLPPDLDGAPAPAPVVSGVALLSPMGAQGPYSTVASPLSQTLFPHDDPLNRPGSSAPGARTLFVGNLPFHCQWQDLKDLFRQAGTILRADVALGQDGRSRGFGMVSFASDLDADRAVKMFNGYEYNGRPLKVHHDKFAGSTQPLTAPTSPLPTASFAQPSGGMGGPPTHIPMPQHGHVTGGYPFEMFLASGPSTPYAMFPGPAQMHNYQQIQNAVLQHMPSDQNFDGYATSTNTSPQTNGSPSTGAPMNGNSNKPSPHAHHPGPIALPPLPPPGAILIPGTHALSPYGHPLGTPLGHPMSPMHPAHMHHPHMLMTPHGLPPITPSMPSFTFVSQPSPATTNGSNGGLHGLGLGPSIAGAGRMPSVSEHSSSAETSPTTGAAASAPTNGSAPQPQSLMSPSAPTFGAYHPMSPMAGYAASMGLLSPGVPFSPGVALTPGSFWGQPGRGHMNPAVGAPVRLQQEQQQRQQQQYQEPASYFPPVDTGYFPPVSGPAQETQRTTSNSSGSGSSLGAGSPATVAETTATTTDGTSAWSGSVDTGADAGMDGLLGRLGKFGLAPAVNGSATGPSPLGASLHARKDSRTFSLSNRARPSVVGTGVEAPPPLPRGDSDPPPAVHQGGFNAPAAFSPTQPVVGGGRAGPPRHLSADALSGVGVGVSAVGKRLAPVPGTLSLAGLGLGVEHKRSY